ncbi:translation initiation factor IF-2 subunit gamma [Candidatus Woesearchaeota archaeon]|nr:MAG: translation initiation factor IF-2 subunit gamma [Candidatus Woesearchaeota archaeon]
MAAEKKQKKQRSSQKGAKKAGASPGTASPETPAKSKHDKNSDHAQPEVNIGLVGHVDHGKTTLTERLSGKWTDTHSEELKRGITIRLGYADSAFYEIPGKSGVERFTTSPFDEKTKKPNTFLRKVSFVDAPGHESLMATMLAGTTIIDGALLLVAANEPCPQPQTKEHLMALQICGIDNVIVVQNKIDVVSSERAMRNYNQIKEFLKETKFADAPIIPVSAQRGVNIDALIAAIQEFIPTPKRDETKPPIFVVARSFDVNKPGIRPRQFKGGVLGGALKQGVLRRGTRVELRPGRIVEEQNKVVAKPLFAKIKSIMTGGFPVEEVRPGGSVGIMTDLDPAMVFTDAMAGNVVGLPGELPPVWNELVLETHLLERVVGSAEEIRVNPLIRGEVLMLNVNSAATVGLVRQVHKNNVVCVLKKPVCAEVGARVTISRRVGNRFRLIGYGILQEA